MKTTCNIFLVLVIACLVALDGFERYSGMKDAEMQTEVRRAAHKTPHIPRHWHYRNGNFYAEGAQ